MTEELLLCQCGDPSHQLIIFYDDEQEVPTVYVTVHLSPNRNLVVFRQPFPLLL